ncbi:lamina-associated polypeptide 2, isoforms alpha/zeta-like [Pantherophis guttatus]|uniref:Lamina-associated polypeptide 2, isoforms alpha/zeta-like n=1 Tax=Pantherophis guttatus TaxID=94885 RepID=A0ABM3ZH21_PANGU|nr:lamina-associated polypeptide 2, isoforms alpha/zeta-like [Pantherophis guttatus]
MLARVIKQGLAQCLQQGNPAPEPHLLQHHRPDPAGDSVSELDLADSVASPDHASLSELDEVPDPALSDDEGLVPDRTPFIGLFKPQLFRSLLRKAIVTTRLGNVSSVPPDSVISDPASAVFAEAAVDPETIPAPKLFLDVLQRQWNLPGAGPSPNSLDKRLYNSAPALSDLLQPSPVDAPIVALCNSSHPAGPPEISLCPEDRRAEKTLGKGHQAAAWAIRASSSASFFNRAALLWIKQLQDRIQPTDMRSRQDLNKISAALEFSADATLNATRFAAKALSSNVTSRRLLWLRNWNADMRSKWQLASASYSAGSLFGPPLEPLLVETRD